MMENKETIMKRAEEAVLHTYNRYPLVLEKGEGVYLYDTDGKQYLDFAAGIAVQGLGYHYPGYDEALKEQIDRLMKEMFRSRMSAGKVNWMHCRVRLILIFFIIRWIPLSGW